MRPFDLNKKNFLYFSAGLIILAGVLAYANSLHAPFIFDDLSFMENNPAIYGLKNFHSIRGFHNARPVGTYTFALNYYFHGLNVFGYHLVNLVIHLLSALTVWWLMLLIFATPRLKNEKLDEYKEWIALFSALIFVAHPVQTQAVTYITQRYSSLSALFYLAALALYIRGRLLPGKDAVACLAGAGAPAVLGMLTKEHVVTLPFSMLLAEVLFFKEPRHTKEKKIWAGMAILLVFAAALIIPAAYSFNVGAVLGQKFVSESHASDIITSGNYFLTQLRVVVTYIRLLFLPINQNLDYDYPLSHSLWEGPTLLSAGFLLLLLGAAVKMLRRQPLVAWGIFMFFITLSVESSIVPIPHVIFEHRLYLPFFGFACLLPVIFYTMMQNKQHAAWALSGIVLLLACLTYQRNAVWNDEILFWQDTIKKSPAKARPYDNLAAVYISRGDYAQALANLQKAHERDPYNAATYNNFGLVYLQQGDFARAAGYFKRAVTIVPGYGRAWNNLGNVSLKQNDLPKAQLAFQKATEVSPELLEPRLNLAGINEREGHTAEALRRYTEIQEIFPHDGNSLYAVLRLSLSEGKTAAAVAAAEKMLARVKDPVILTSAGSFLAQGHFHKPAIKLYQKAVRLAPRYVPAYVELGKLLGNLDRFDAAIAVWQKALTIEPHHQELKDLMQAAEGLKQ